MGSRRYCHRVNELVDKSQIIGFFSLLFCVVTSSNQYPKKVILVEEKLCRNELFWHRFTSSCVYGFTIHLIFTVFHWETCLLLSENDYTLYNTFCEFMHKS